MSGSPRVMVAGAGVVGLTTALVLAEAGCAVTICDPGGPNASSVAAGMIAPVFEAVLDEAARQHFDLLMAARDLWPGLAARTGIKLDQSGAIAVGAPGWLDRVGARFNAIHLRPTELGRETATAMAPGLVMPGDRALLTREDWRLEARPSLQALLGVAAAAGVTVRPSLVPIDHGSDFLVVATGARPGVLAPEQRRLTPIKGHIVRLAHEASGVVVRSEGVYAVPGAQMVFGATMEIGRDDTTIDLSQSAPLLAAGRRLFPGLADCPAEVSVGVRAATPDGLPMVGPSAEPGTLLAVGARRNGWLLAPLMAQIIAACVTGRDPGPYAARLDPRRFGE